jgi:hypothetical protein
VCGVCLWAYMYVHVHTCANKYMYYACICDVFVALATVVTDRCLTTPGTAAVGVRWVFVNERACVLVCLCNVHAIMMSMCRWT